MNTLDSFKSISITACCSVLTRVDIFYRLLILATGCEDELVFNMFSYHSYILSSAQKQLYFFWIDHKLAKIVTLNLTVSFSLSLLA